MNLYGYVKNNPVAYRDPSGKIPIVPIILGGGAIAGELGLHLYLSSRARSIPWTGGDGLGRKSHCYVNCMSVRIHLGSPTPVNLAGSGQEAVNLGQYWSRGDMAFGVDDSAKDMMANFNGQGLAFIIWKSCQELCDTCQ